MPETAKPRFGGGGEKCHRCKKTVYFAEQRDGPGSTKYHKSCFSCVMCAKSLDSTYAERQEEIYCKTCYGREFGPKTFGYSPSRCVRCIDMSIVPTSNKMVTQLLPQHDGACHTCNCRIFVKSATAEKVVY